VILDERKPVKLSFAIQKAPERKKLEISTVKKKVQLKEKKEPEEPKTIVIPDEFIKIAKRFGLPKDNYDFFYRNRDSFHWESKDLADVHCTESSCKHTVKPSSQCLVDHMITAHNYTDIPCDKTDCSYVAFSKKNLMHHKLRFHGHGKRPTEYGNHKCPKLSCNSFFRWPSDLRKHVDVHENRVLSCNYCQYRNANPNNLHDHLSVHFNLKNYKCDLCSSKFFKKKGLKLHLKVIHSTDDFVCVDCGFTSTKLSNYNMHRASCKERLKHFL
jgi:hypothetical protein